MAHLCYGFTVVEMGGNGDCPVRYVKLPEVILEVAFSKKVMKYEIWWNMKMKYASNLRMKKNLLPLNLRVLDRILR